MLPKLSLLFTIMVVLVLLAGCVSVEFTNGAYDYKEYDEKVLDIAPTIFVDNFQGSIILESSTDGKVKIQSEKYLRGGTEENLRKVAAQYTINISHTSSTIYVKTDRPKTRPDGVSGAWISFRIFLPRDMNLRVITSNGSINVNGFQAEAKLKTSNGPIVVSEHIGHIEAETNNASIDILHSSGSLDLDTSNGKLTINDFKGDIIADTSNGRIEVNSNELVTKANLKTSNGSIEFKGRTVSNGYYSLRTSNGAIKVYLENNKGYDITARTTNGRINFTFPIKFAGTYEKNFIKGKVGNDAGAEFDVNTSNGEITFEEWSGK